jgi:hypothetical protein
MVGLMPFVMANLGDGGEEWSGWGATPMAKWCCGMLLLNLFAEAFCRSLLRKL